MKKLFLVAAFGLTAIALGAPAAAPAATPAQPTMTTSTTPPPPANPERAARMEQRRAEAAQMKKDLKLTDAQESAMRNENERFRGVLIAARAEHRANIGKILTPEQKKTLEAKMKEHRGAEGDEMEGDDDHAAPKDKPRDKGKR